MNKSAWPRANRVDFVEEVNLSCVWYVDKPNPKQDVVFSEIKAQLATIIAMLQQQHLDQKKPEPQPENRSFLKKRLMGFKWLIVN